MVVSIGSGGGRRRLLEWTGRLVKSVHGASDNDGNKEGDDKVLHDTKKIKIK